MIWRKTHYFRKHPYRIFEFFPFFWKKKQSRPQTRRPPPPSSTRHLGIYLALIGPAVKRSFHQGSGSQVSCLNTPCLRVQKHQMTLKWGTIDMILTLLIGTWFNNRDYNAYWWNRDCKEYWWFLHSGSLWLLNRYTARSVITLTIPCIHQVFKHA